MKSIQLFSEALIRGERDMAGNGRHPFLLNQRLKPNKKQVVNLIAFERSLIVSTDCEEVNQLPLWLQRIDIPSLTPSNLETPKKRVADARCRHPIAKIRGISDIYPKQHVNIEKTDASHCFERLETCTSVKNLRRATEELDMKNDQKLELSTSAFRRLLETRCNLENILRFLSDPSLNVPEAHNIQRLWRWFINEPRNKTDSLQLHKWIRKHISLGMVSTKELQDLVETALHSSDFCSGTQQDMDLCLSILNGLTTSRVYQITDLNSSILNRLFQLAFCNYSWRNPQLQSLGFKLLEACEPRQLRDMVEGTSALLSSYLVSTGADEDIYTVERQILVILNSLVGSSEIQASRSIAYAIHTILKRFRSSSSDYPLAIRNLGCWWRLLLHHETFELIKHKSEWLRIERVLARDDLDLLCSYLKHLGDHDKCVFLLRHCVINDVEENDDRLFSNVSDFLATLEKNLGDRKSEKYPFVCLLQYLGPKVSTGSNLLPRLFSILNKLEMYDTMLSTFSHLRQMKSPFQISALARLIIDYTLSNSQFACTLFKIAPSLPLESCPDIAEMMIHDPDGSPGGPLGFLALRQSSLGVSTIYPRTVPEVRRAQIQLLNRMALAYAHASHLYPRVAFRQVYQCYLILLRRHGRHSLGVDISRALTVAGVVRPLQKAQWVNTTKLNFVLNIVREIEGDEVASKVDELVYTWRDELIRKNAARASEMRLIESLRVCCPDAEEETTPTQQEIEPTRVEASEAEALWMADGSLGKLPGETNAEEFLRVRGARDLEYARASQIAAMRKHGVVDKELLQMNAEISPGSDGGTSRLSRGLPARGRITPVNIAFAQENSMQTNPNSNGDCQEESHGF